MYTTTRLVHHVQSLALLKICAAGRVQGLVASCLLGAGQECNGLEVGARVAEGGLVLTPYSWKARC